MVGILLVFTAYSFFFNLYFGHGNINNFCLKLQLLLCFHNLDLISNFNWKFLFSCTNEQLWLKVASWTCYTMDCFYDILTLLLYFFNWSIWLITQSNNCFRAHNHTIFKWWSLDFWAAFWDPNKIVSHTRQMIMWEILKIVSSPEFLILWML